MDRFSGIYFINLEHRTDRLEHIMGELDRMGADWDKIHRIEGIRMPFFGILGCGKSHAIAMEKFIEDEDDPNAVAMFLEDDFHFMHDKAITNRLLEEIYHKIGDDTPVFMLSSYALEFDHIDWFQTMPDMELKRVIRGQTLSGYLVKRSYAPKMLENFKEGIQMLEQLGYGEYEYCVDVHVRELQKESIWLYSKPAIGCQMESYSDIQNKVTDYGL